MTSFTVTATQGGSKSNGMAMQAVVFTGQAATQNGASGSHASAVANISITPNASGSYIVGALLGTSATLTAEAGTTFFQTGIHAALNWTQFRDTVTGTGGVAETVGATSATTGILIAAAEVLAATPGTLAISPTSPAATAYAGVETQTTAAFSPPRGSLIVLLVSSNGGASTTTMTVTDTSGLGLTWTEASHITATGDGYTGVWMAVVPAAVPPQRSPVRSRLLPRRGGRALASPVLAVPPPAVGPPLRPLTSPVTPRQSLPPRGIVRGIAGAALIVSVIGPQLTPLRQPVHAAVRVQPQRGRVTGITRAGPPVPPPVPAPLYALHGPARGRTVPLPAGRAVAPARHVTVVAPTSGPPLTPLTQPVRARQPLPASGRASAIVGIPIGQAPTTGPVLLPRTQPVRARQPLPASGRASAIVGIPVGQAPTTGPAFIPLTQPAGSRAILLRTGHVQSLPGATPSAVGPALRPASQPVRARQPLPAPGTARTMAILYAGFSGPSVYPLHGPVRARQPLPLPGRTYTTPLPAPPPAPTTGPPLQSRSQPVKAFAALRGTGRAMAILAYPLPVTPTTGTALLPRSQPVRAPIPQRIRGGSGHGSQGVISQAGPAFVPLHGPVRARQPFPAPGRAMAMAPIPIFAPQSVPPPPLTQPAGARVSLIRAGHWQANPGQPGVHGPPVYPLHGPIRARFPLPPHGTAQGHGGRQVVPAFPAVFAVYANRTTWETSGTELAWQAGRPYPDWLLTPPRQTP